MKLKLGQLNQISNILQIITSESKAQVKVMYSILQKVIKINELLKPLEETRSKLITKYKITDTTDTNSTSYKSYINDLQEVLNIEVDCDVKLPISDIENFEITGTDMFLIQPILDAPENNIENNIDIKPNVEIDNPEANS